MTPKVRGVGQNWRLFWNNDIIFVISEYEARLVKIKTITKPTCLQCTLFSCFMALLIMLGFQQRSVSFVFPKISQKRMLNVI